MRIRTPEILQQILCDEIDLLLKLKPLKIPPSFAAHDVKSATQNTLTQPGSTLSACAREVVDGCFRSVVTI